MTLRELLESVDDRRVIGDPDLDIEGIAYDSRRVGRGFVFVCIAGARYDGHDFVGEALQMGAPAVVVQRRLDLPAPCCQVVVPDTRAALGLMAAKFFGYPSRRLRLIGVTGTNGKTTTAHLIASVLRESGHRVGLVGTVGYEVGARLVPASRTTPESADLQALFSEMVGEGADYAVTEVSSHGVRLRRIVGCEYDVGVFTNITQDHLDFHGSFADYLAAKMEFFESLQGPGSTKSRKAAVVNSDDPHAARILEGISVDVLTYGMDSGADVRAHGVRVDASGSYYRASTPAGDVDVRLRIVGRFNVLNSLAALAVGVVEGASLDSIAHALGQARWVPGRFESVDCGQDFLAIVDYAHTPDGLLNVLRTARELTKGKVILVFGCGGDRDRGKRPMMGEIAAECSDHCLVTSDNPRSENPEEICIEIEAGMRRGSGRKGFSYDVVPDRRQAIRLAVQRAGPGDLVLVAGKGHETYQIFRDRTIPFDDKEELREALAQSGRCCHGSPENPGN